MELDPQNVKDLVANGGTYLKRFRNCLAPRNTRDDKYIPIAGMAIINSMLVSSGLMTSLTHDVAALPHWAQLLVAGLSTAACTYGPSMYIKGCHLVSRGFVDRKAVRIEATVGRAAAKRYRDLNAEPA